MVRPCLCGPPRTPARRSRRSNATSLAGVDPDHYIQFDWMGTVWRESYRREPGEEGHWIDEFVRRYRRQNPHNAHARETYPTSVHLIGVGAPSATLDDVFISRDNYNVELYVNGEDVDGMFRDTDGWLRGNVGGIAFTLDEAIAYANALVHGRPRMHDGQPGLLALDYKNVRGPRYARVVDYDREEVVYEVGDPANLYDDYRERKLKRPGMAARRSLRRFWGIRR